MSASGMMVKVSSIGMFVFVFRILAEMAPMMYPVARWPTANDWFASVYGEESFEGSNKCCIWIRLAGLRERGSASSAIAAGFSL